MEAVTLTLRCDPEPLLTALAELTARIEAASASFGEAGERFPKALQGLVDGIDAPSELVRFEVDGLAAASASELVVRLYPGDGLRVVSAALGASDVQ